MLLTEGMFPHVFKAGLDKTWPRDGVLLASTAVINYDSFTSARKQKKEI